jgi:ubiquinone/menaquinone biosynthesis C-methylase UbiE
MAVFISQESLRTFFDNLAPNRDRWIHRYSFYYDELTRVHTSLIVKESSVLDIGCGTGHLLAHMKPKRGVGVDFSHEMIKVAQKNYPHLTFRVMDAHKLEFNETFDYIVLSNLVGYTEDIWQVFRELQSVCHKNTRIIVSNYNYLWQPFFTIAEKLQIKMPDQRQNWLPQEFLRHFLYLNGFSVVKQGKYLHSPFHLGGLGKLVNRIFSVLPIVNNFGCIEYIVARPTFFQEKLVKHTSVSIIVPTYNEAGNISTIVEQMPKIGTKTELIFVDYPGIDRTHERILQVKRKYSGPLTIKLVQQKLKDGKIGALRLGVKKATGEILLTFDADVTIPPRDLLKFYTTLVEGRAEVINGTRLVYPTEKGAMRFLNFLANAFFAHLFSWALQQHFTDTLCGSKGLYKKDFERFEKEITSYDHLDRYGDYFLLLHAYTRNLQIAEVPLRYTQRKYGDTKLQRFTNGWQFLRVFVYFFWQVKLKEVN